MPNRSLVAEPGLDNQADPLGLAQPDSPASYRPGVCNIGPAEIGRRRRAGRVGAIAAAGLAVGLAAVGAPPITRFVVAAPAAVSASGFLQARLRFCAGFGSLGVYNFGDVGPRLEVFDDDARAADRAMALRIGAASAAIGTAVGLVAVLTAR